MSVRSITRKDKLAPIWTVNPYDFPKDKDGILYVRQSSDEQRENNIHSYEMQTDKFVEHFRNMGCTGNIGLIEDDEGMSGTLDIHKRPGMSRLMKLIEQSKLGLNNLGWIGTVHVNRLFRDQWMINPDMFMKACFESNIYLVTLRTVFNFKDPNYQRLFRIEAEEAARHLEWMKLIMGGALDSASDNGLYDGRYLNVGYIVDRSDLKRKKYVVYRPHALVVQWLFRHFLELDGNFQALCKEIDQMEYLFPAFDAWVDEMNMGGKFRMKPDSQGYYKPTNTGLYGILTNPVYIGWWIPRRGGVVKNNHEPIVDEGLFVYAHKRVSRFTLEGERQKPAKIVRFGKADALLRKVAVGSRASVYVRPEERDAYYSSLVLTSDTRVTSVMDFSLSVRKIDEIFLWKFFQRLSAMKKDQGWQDRGEQIQNEREQHIKLIEKAIEQADSRMRRIISLLENEENPLPQSMIDNLVKDYRGLEQKKAELEKERLECIHAEESDEAVLYEIHTLIPDIFDEWHNLPFAKRMKFIKAIIHQVVFHRASPSWVEMRIEWKEITGFDFVDVAYIRLTDGGGRRWTKEEEEMLSRLYPEGTLAELMQALPSRSYSAIQSRRSDLKIARKKGAVKFQPEDQHDFSLCLQDYQYMKEVELSNDILLHWFCQ